MAHTQHRGIHEQQGCGRLHLVPALLRAWSIPGIGAWHGAELRMWCPSLTCVCRAVEDARGRVRRVPGAAIRVSLPSFFLFLTVEVLMLRCMAVSRMDGR